MSSTMAAMPPDAIDQILALQCLVGWAGEGRCEPKRFGFWDTDLVDMAGGADLLARLAPRTHRWASLKLVREAARRVDARARHQHSRPDDLRTIFFLGFDIDEAVSLRLIEHRRSGRLPHEALRLPFELGARFEPDRVASELTRGPHPGFDEVLPIGRRLRGPMPEAPDEMVRHLVAALVPVSDAYPMPFYVIGA